MNQLCKCCYTVSLHGFKYCINHKCPMEECKNNYKCEEHVCKVFCCYNIKVSNNTLCKEHKCPVEGCNNSYMSCSEHICDEYFCRSVKLSGYNYCSKHLTFNDLVNIAQKERPYVPNDIWNEIGKYKY
jgi:hypothetical protein